MPLWRLGHHECWVRFAHPGAGDSFGVVELQYSDGGMSCLLYDPLVGVHSDVLSICTQYMSCVCCCGAVATDDGSCVYSRLTSIYMICCLKKYCSSKLFVQATVQTTTGFSQRIKYVYERGNVHWCSSNTAISFNSYML